MILRTGGKEHFPLQTHVFSEVVVVLALLASEGGFGKFLVYLVLKTVFDFGKGHANTLHFIFHLKSLQLNQDLIGDLALVALKERSKGL